MSIRGFAGCVLVVGLLAAFGIGIVTAQEAGGAGGRRGGAGGRFGPEQMMERMNMKENLKATDEEWKVLQPRLEKVMTLSRETAGGGMRMMAMGGRRGEGGPRGDRGQGQGQGRVETAVERAAQDLQATLDNANATPQDVQAKLTALREAREKAKQELAQAQASLREVITARQEAQLVLMGLLD